MGNLNIKNKIKKSTLLTIGIVVILMIAAVFLWVGNNNSLQSEPPISPGVSFQGDYKIGDGDWHPIAEGQHIPATKGDVYLRGFFQLHNPENNEPLGPLSPGTSVSLYMNHLRGTVHLPSGENFSFDAENKQFGEDACAIMWGYFITTEDETVTIQLHNPHRYGNENAVDEFLTHLSIAPGIYHESIMLEKGASQRYVGMLILISSLIILGIAAFSSIIHIKYSKELWLIGLMSLFAGGYFLFDAFAVCLWNHSYIINTRALGLCMMFYVLFCQSLFVVLLRNRIPLIATLISAGTVLSCILLSLFSDIKFFDTWLYWTLIQLLISLVFVACLIRGFKGTALPQKILLSFGILTILAFQADAVATYFGWWEGGSLSKGVFIVTFVLALIMVLRVIPSHINAAIKARELEAEQQALKLELQESRISMMLSQMQPHFIFNTLNTIYHLCELDPNKARSTISSFSEYLRNNIDNLGHSDMISFEKELSFVKTYLDIEKVRFDEELEIFFDIQATNFKLPVLTVQPIVENAVKHGTSKKEGVSQLYVITRESDTCYEIIIRDTGVGFDSQQQHSDGHTHVGLTNVRQRLENLCNGTLTIESQVGVGTTATIIIPKRRNA